MTQTPIAPARPDDIVLEDEDLTRHLDRQADEILARGEGRSFEHLTSVRQAVRDDAALLRAKVSGRLDQGRETIQDHPMKATLYALGLGVIVGMILRR